MELNDQSFADTSSQWIWYNQSSNVLGLAYRLTSVPESNDDGSWMNWEVEMVFDAKSGGILANLPTGKDIYLEARNFRNKVKDGDIKVSADDSQDANDDF